MQISKTILGLALILIAHASASVTEAEAIRGYARQLAKSHLDPNRGAWDWEQAGNGGYLIRYRADFTGDGIPDLLLTGSFAARRGDASWEVFRGETDGTLSAFAGEITASVSSLWVKREGNGVELICPGVPENGPKSQDAGFPTPVNHYRLAFPHIEKTTETLTEAGIRALRKTALEIPQAEALLLSDFLRGSGEWTAVKDWDANLNGYLYRNEDWSRAVEDKDFTPQVAYDLAGGEQRRDAERRAADRVAAPVSDSSSAESAVSSSRAGKSTGVLMGWIGAGLLAVVIGIRLRVKRRPRASRAE